MVSIVFGADHDQADVAGRAVREVRASYKNVFNIPDDAIAKVGGKQVTEEYALKDGEKLVFDKSADKYAGEPSGSLVVMA